MNYKNTEEKSVEELRQKVKERRKELFQRSNNERKYRDAELKSK
jgi:hypothetical protein